MASKYCEARSAPFPIESCCGHTSRCSGTPTWPACSNCGQVPAFADPPQLAQSLCLKPLGHRGRCSWAVA